MSEERLKRLAKDLEEGRLKPVYLFEGPDEYRKLRALEALKRVAIGESPAAMAFEWLEGVPAARVCELARTVPFFVGKRLLVATGVEKYGDADLAALSEYAAEPAPDAVVVFWAEGNLDRRKKLFKLFEKIDATYGFDHLAGRARAARIAAEAEKLGLKLSEDAVAYLDFALAPDLFTVVRELEKLAAYAGDEEVSAATVAEVAATSRVEKAYDTVRYVGEGKLALALAALRRLVIGGERPESIIGLFARQVRLIWLAKELRDAGLGPAEIASRLKVPPLYVSEYVGAAERLDADRLLELHHLLAELDRGVKTGRVPAALALELFAARAAT
jgi:DNA polymerase-3 subunit delta